MADGDKKDQNGTKPGSDFEDLKSLAEEDWSSALDEWDATFDQIGVAEPSAPKEEELLAVPVAPSDISAEAQDVQASEVTAQGPQAEATAQGPQAEATAQEPEAEATAQEPEAEATAQEPEAEATAQGLEAEAAAQEPEAEAKAQEPEAEAAAQEPEAEATAQGLEAEAAAQEPEAEATAQEPEAEATAQGPEAEATAQGPEAEATAQGPEAAKGVSGDRAAEAGDAPEGEPMVTPSEDVLPSAHEAAARLEALPSDLDFDFNLDRSEALGAMLSNLKPAEDAVEAVSPALPRWARGAGARGDDAPGGFESPGAVDGAPTPGAEFDESTRLVSPEDQLRLARSALEAPDREGGGDDFEESTRLVSAEDQLRLARSAARGLEPDGLDADAPPEVTVSVDDEFYDSISIEGEPEAAGAEAAEPGAAGSEAAEPEAAESEAAEPEAAEPGAAGSEAAESEAAEPEAAELPVDASEQGVVETAADAGEAESRAQEETVPPPGETSTEQSDFAHEEITAERPYVAVPPDARREQEGASEPPPPTGEQGAIGEAQPARVGSAAMEVAFADESVEHLPTPPPADVAFDEETPAGGPDVLGLLDTLAGEPSLESGAPTPDGAPVQAPDSAASEAPASVEEETASAEAPAASEVDTATAETRASVDVDAMATSELDGSEVAPAGSDDDALGSLDALLGIPSSAAEAPSLVADEGELSSVDRLLYGGEESPVPAPGVEQGLAARSAPASGDDGLVRVHRQLPDPPASRRLEALADQSRAEPTVTQIPAIEGLAPLPERPPLDGLSREGAEPISEQASLQTVAEWIEQELRFRDQGSDSAELAAGLGALWEAWLDRPDAAREAYADALSADEASTSARVGLVRLARLEQDWGTALEHAAALGEQGDPDQRVGYATLQGLLALYAMGDAAQARDRFEALGQQEQGAIWGGLGLLDVAVFEGDSALAAEAFCALADRTPSPDLSGALRLEAGRRYEVLEQDDRAEACYAEAARGSGEVAQQALAGLVRIAFRAEARHALATQARALLAQVKSGPWRSHLSAVLSAALQKVEGESEQAFHVARAAAEEAEEDLFAWQRYARLAEARGEAEVAAEAWERVSALCPDGVAAAHTLVRAGRIREHALGTREPALKLYRAAQDRGTGATLPRIALAECLLSAPDPVDRVEALGGQLAGAESGQAPVRMLAAWVLSREGRIEEAVRVLQDLPEPQRDAPDVRLALAQCALRSGDGAAAREAFVALAQVAAPEMARAAALQAADWAYAAADSAAGRLEACTGLMEEIGEEVTALRWRLARAQRAAGRQDEWQASLAALADRAEDAPTTRRWLWQMRLAGLEAAAPTAVGAPTGEGASGELASGEADAAEPATGSTEEAGAVSGGRFGDSSDAMPDPLARLYELDPDSADVLWQVVRHHSRSQDFGAAAEAWGAWAEGLAGHPVQRLLRIGRGLCLEERVEDLEAAQTVYEALATEVPGMTALEQMRHRLLRWMGRSDEVAERLQRDARERQGAARVAPLVLASQAWAHIGRWEEAMSSLREALSVTPGDPMVLGLLEEAEAAAGAWAERADRVLRVLREAEDDAVRLAAYEQLARVDRDGRGDLPSAVLGYESLVRLSPAHQRALRELESYYPTVGRWAELGKITALLVESVRGRDRSSLAVECARILTELGDEVGALAMLRSVVAVDAHPGLAVLSRLDALGRAETMEAGERAALYRELAAQFASDGRFQAAFLMRAADALISADREAEAIEVLRAAGYAAPTYLPAIRERLRLALLTGAHREAVDAAEALAAASELRATRADMRLLAGVLAEERLGDAERALGNYRAAMEQQPDRSEAFERMRQLLRGRADHAALAALLRDRLAKQGERQSTAPLLWELARLEAEPLGEPEAAKDTLRKLIAVDDSHLEAVRMAASLYEADGQWLELAEMLVRWARLERDRETLVTVFHRLGTLYGEHIGDPKRAVASLTKVVQMDPNHLDALERLSDLYMRTEEWKPALAVTGRLVEVDPDPARRIGHLVKLSRILETGYRDLRRAREALIRAVELLPQDLAAIEALAQFYERQQDRRSLMVHLDRSVTRVRARVQQDPFDVAGLRDLKQVLVWRGVADQVACAGATLDALGVATGEEQKLAEQARLARVPLSRLAEAEADEILLPESVPSGFVHAFRILTPLLGRTFRQDLSRLGAGRATRVPRSGDPLRELGNEIAAGLGVSGFDLHVVPGTLLRVEPYDPPAVLLGEDVVAAGSTAEHAFLLGRCLKAIQLGIVLPLALGPDRLRTLTAAVVRQFVPDFDPPDVPPSALAEQGRIVSKALSRKVRQELMPFAMECSAIEDFGALHAGLVRLVNRVALAISGEVRGALWALIRVAGRAVPDGPLESVARGLPEVEDLIRFSVSETYFELRARMLGG